MKYLTSHPIDREMFLKQGDLSRGAGASISFFGIVRDSHNGRKVTHLIYEAYESMAEEIIGGLIRKATRVWPILDVKVLHRIGKVAAGEIAVAIEVSSAHRHEAYLASRFLTDEVKANAPIWKKEYFEDGIYHWGSCDHSHGSKFQTLMEIKAPHLDRKDIRISSPEKHEQHTVGGNI